MNLPGEQIGTALRRQPDKQVSNTTIPSTVPSALSHLRSRPRLSPLHSLNPSIRHIHIHIHIRIHIHPDTDTDTNGASSVFSLDRPALLLRPAPAVTSD